MLSGIASGSRSIVISLHALENLDQDVALWLDRNRIKAVFSVAMLASPTRDGGEIEQILAIDGLSDSDIARLLVDLDLDPAVEPFRSGR